MLGSRDRKPVEEKLEGGIRKRAMAYPTVPLAKGRASSLDASHECLLRVGLFESKRMLHRKHSGSLEALLRS